MRSRNRRAKFFLLYIFSATVALAEPVPFADRPVNIFTNDLKTNRLILAPRSNRISDALQELREQHGIHISQVFLGGVIYVTDDRENGAQGYDVHAELDHPLILPWYQAKWPSPNQEEQEFNEKEAAELLRYAKENEPSARNDKRIAYTYAITPFHHILIQARDIEGFVLVKKTGRLRRSLAQTLFHETMHVLHHAKLAVEVEKMLDLPGGFYERRKAIQAACPQFLIRLGEEGSFNNKTQDFCGHKSLNELRRAYALKYKIPQRDGERVGIENLGGDGWCWRHESDADKRVVIQGEKLCRHGEYEDIHSFVDGSEYFAIMMELKTFHPEEFARVASPAEKAFFESVYARFLRRLKTQAAATSPTEKQTDKLEGWLRAKGSKAGE